MKKVYVGVRELKNNLSKYLREVKNGHAIVITERGIPIGHIIPRKASLDERLYALVEAGLVEWNGRKLESRKPTIANQSSRQVSDLLVEMRE
jgi:prevent-host-death family protein